MSGWTGRCRGFSSSALKNPSFGFSGCGWLLPYHLGVIHLLRERGLINKDSVVAGSSGGSIAATIVKSGLCAREAMKIVSDLGSNEEFKADMDVGIRKFVLDLLPSEDFYLQCNDKLYITVTQLHPEFTRRATLVSKFSSNCDLVSAISTSCFIPLWTNRRLTTNFRGAKAIDGGVFAFMPPVGQVTVTPLPRLFSIIQATKKKDKRKIASISPLLLPEDHQVFNETKLAYWGLNVPASDVLQQLFDYGYDSALIWANRESPLEQH